MGKSTVQRSPLQPAAKTPRAPLDPNTPPGITYVHDTKIVMTCARCNRRCIYDRPQFFTRAQNNALREMRLKKKQDPSMWLHAADTEPASLNEIDMPRCPCGEQYKVDEHGNFFSAFPRTAVKGGHDAQGKSR